MVDFADTHSFQVEPGRYSKAASLLSQGLDFTSRRSVTPGMTKKWEVPASDARVRQFLVS